MPDNDHIFLTIRSRQDVTFQANVKAVSGWNQTGPFDVLPQHAYFISLIEKWVVIHHLDGRKQQIEIGSGIMHVSANIVNIYIQ